MTLNYHVMATVGCDKKKTSKKVECTMSSLLQFKLELETICEWKYFVFVYNREAKSCIVD